MSKLLVLLVCAGVAAVHSAATGQGSRAALLRGTCDEDEFQCGDGDCISALYRCNGAPYNYCDDGSEQKGCDALPSVALPVNTNATARVQFAEAHYGLEVHVCGAEDCASLYITGMSEDGALAYWRYSNCNLQGRFCGDEQFFGSHDHSIPAGELVLEVQHRPGEVAVWQQNVPESVAVLPVDYSLLRIRPYIWGVDMAVEFTESSDTTPSPPSTPTSLEPTDTTLSPSSEPADTTLSPSSEPADTTLSPSSEPSL